MAVDKLVDSTQLDSDLTSVANAIRTKGGTSAQLAFPAGFVSAIGNISAGGDYIAEDWLDKTKPSGNIVTDKLFTHYDGKYMLSSRANITNVTFNESVCVGEDQLRNSDFQTFTGKKVTTLYNNAFYGSGQLTHVDILGGTINQAFNNCGHLATIILRSSSVSSLASTAAFTGTPFKSGGTGGTIYIPKSLYDHLGDNSASDYKAASNWSTVDGYGTITWAAIEGSIYETKYADGTDIPTT